MRRSLSFLRLLFAAVAMCVVASGCSSVGTSEGGAAESNTPDAADVTDATADDGVAAEDPSDDGQDDDGGEPAGETAAVADRNTDDSSVLSDPDGEFDDTTIDAVISDCAGGVDAACGQLGGRLAAFDALPVDDQRLAVCTAGPLLGSDGNGHVAAVLTLSIAFADDVPSVIEPIDGIRTGAFDDDSLDGAISSTLDHVESYCAATA